MKNEGGKKNLIKVTEIRATVVGATGATFKGNRWQQVRQVVAGATGGRRLAGGWQAELAGRVGRHLSWQASELAGI